MSQRFLMQSRLHVINFSLDEILKIIRSFDVNKAHGHDDVLIKMIRIFEKSLVKPLPLLFEKCYTTLTFLKYEKN